MPNNLMCDKDPWPTYAIIGTTIRSRTVWPAHIEGQSMLGWAVCSPPPHLPVPVSRKSSDSNAMRLVSPGAPLGSKQTMAMRNRSNQSGKPGLGQLCHLVNL
ncbi:hypothetical protein BsWGS_16880 [Bradybaena similaris]